MGLGLDNYFGVHPQALALREKRASQLANNLANVNTPNYKSQDIDFHKALRDAQSGQKQNLITDSPGHQQGAQDLYTQLKFRQTSTMSLDGNTVDKDIETTEFAHNALDYQANLSFLNNKIKMMLLALRGE